MELDRTDVETPAGTYQIVTYYDEDGFACNPLEEYNHEGMELYVYEREYSGWKVHHQDLDSSAGKALDCLIDDHGGYGESEDVVRRMRKWLALTGNAATFVAGQTRRHYYLALVTGDDYPDPVESIKATMAEWADWSDGYVYGYVVEAPDGKHVDSCWGFIGDDSREYMIDQARDSIEYDAKQRLDQANSAGAGFVGIL